MKTKFHQYELNLQGTFYHFCYSVTFNFCVFCLIPELNSLNPMNALKSFEHVFVHENQDIYVA